MHLAGCPSQDLCEESSRSVFQVCAGGQVHSVQVCQSAQLIVGNNETELEAPLSFVARR